MEAARKRRGDRRPPRGRSAVWLSSPDRSYSCSAMRFSLRLAVATLTLVLLSPFRGPGPRLLAQGPEELRIGLSFGGISLAGFITEYRWGDRSVEINIGTWSFRDLSLSLVGKQYFGPGDFRPFAGLGFWAVFSPAHAAGERDGIAVLARAPVGVEWNADASHHFGTHLSLNRALWIRRRDPMDTTPPTDHLVPLPGFYYLWKR